MQLKSDKITPKNVDFPRSEMNQQTDIRKINIFLLIFTGYFILKTFDAVPKKLKNGFGDEGWTTPWEALTASLNGSNFQFSLNHHEKFKYET